MLDFLTIKKTIDDARQQFRVVATRRERVEGP